MSRYDLIDFEWRVITPLLPNKPRGAPRVDDRRVLNGIFWCFDREHHDATYENAMDRVPSVTTALCDGGRPAYGTD